MFCCCGLLHKRKKFLNNPSAYSLDTWWLLKNFTFYPARFTVGKETFFYNASQQKDPRKRMKEISNKFIHIENIDLKYKWKMLAIFIWGQESIMPKKDIDLNVEFTLDFLARKIFIEENEGEL